MNIAISLLNFRPGAIGGAETYLRQVIPRLAQVRGDDRIVLVTCRENAEAIAAAGLDNVTIDISQREITRARILEALSPWRCRLIERAFDKIRPDVAFFPQQSIFPKNINCPCLLTVVDVQHLLFPQYFSLADKVFRRLAYRRSLRRADHIIAISQYTRDTVIQLCGVDAGKITAVPFGVAGIDAGSILPDDELPRPFLYYPAATFPHKNHQVLLRTYAQLRRAGGFPYKLVLTGKQTNHWPAIAKLIAELGIAGDVIHPGFLPFERIQRIYQAADAIVFPTQFEGFGLPVVEASEFGKKIITSRLAVFDEIGVPRQFQIDFAQPDELSAALAIPGPTHLDKPIRKWSDTACDTLEILRHLGRL
jgi:glycosyltransferase involved in cell wall biosynthesis